MKFTFRRLRVGFGLMACAFGLAGILGAGEPAPVPSAMPAPGSGQRLLNGGQPTPYPLPTLAPLTGETALPYPAYGTPVPGVDAGVQVPGVPLLIGLQQAILIGFARAPSLAIARDDVAVQAAIVRLDQAGLLPTLAGSASLNHAHQQAGAGSRASATGAPMLGGDSTNAAFALTLNQLIFDGGRIAAGVAAARSTEAATADTYRRQLETVAYTIATAYYAYLAAERTTQVDLEIVREDEVQEDLVRAQVRVGTEAPAQIATVQLPTVQARVAVVRAQGTELQAGATFVNAMGLDANARVQPIDDSPVFTAAPVSSIPIPSYDLALRRALALRPDYDSSVQALDAARSSLRAAKLGLFPTLSANGNAQDASTDPNAGSFRNGQTIGLSLAIPLYDGGVTAANTAQAQAQVDIAVANLQTTALGVQLSIKQALTGLVSARAAFDQTQQEYATAVTNVQSTQAQYSAGVTTLPLLLNAQVQIAQALTDRVTAVYTLRQAEQTYLYAVGPNYGVAASESPTPSPMLTPTPTPTPTPRRAAKAEDTAHGV